jgi:hypothetical protein
MTEGLFMSARRIAWVSWAVLGYGLAVVILSPIIVTLTPGLRSGHEPYLLSIYAFSLLSFALLGALIAVRRPGNRLGWVLSTIAFIHASDYLLANISTYLLYGEPAIDVAAGKIIAWLFVWTSMLHYGPELTLVFLLFPDGRLPSPRWWPVFWLALAATLVSAVAIAVLPGPLTLYGFDNPYGIEGTLPVAVASTGVLLGLICAIASVASLFRRYRRAGGSERAQLKWFLYGGAVAILAALAIVLLGIDIPNAAQLLSQVTVVMATFAAIAIFRHHLYDIDLLINRTLVYGLTSIGLAIAFFAGIVILQGLLRPVTGGSEISVAASTLGTLGLVGPLRRRAQAGVDRRFYRSRFDAARTVDDFAVRLRDQVDLDAVRVDLAATVHQTMQPAHLSVWIRDRRNDSRTPAA